jgi:hypothetical protein
MPYLIQLSVERQHNVIVRPRGATIELVQLDDLSQAGLERLKTTAFLILTTSPENYQVWVAVRECDAELAGGCAAAAAPIRAPLAPVESQAALISNASTRRIFQWLRSWKRLRNTPLSRSNWRD